MLFSVFVIASCGLAYELVAGALSSYLLGDSVTQFSTVIGTYLFAMGAGSWLSRYVTRDLVGAFVRIDIADDALAPLLTAQGLVHVDDALRMTRGTPAAPGAQRAFALVNQALG